MKFWIMLAAAFIAATGSAQAAVSSRCYSPDEAQAEQVLRLHSELMVITVTCHYGSSGEDLVKAYTGFTRNNIDVLHDAEATMTGYYKKAYGGKGVDRLDKLRTMLANEYGQQIANASAPIFCNERRDKVLALYNATPASLQGEIQQVSGKTYAPLCGGAVKTAQNK